MRAGELVLDERRHEVTVSGKPVALTPIEFSLLQIMMRSPGRVFSRNDLVDLLNGSHFTGMDSTLNVHVRNLRTKLAPADYIETVFGVGYRFKAE